MFDLVEGRTVLLQIAEGEYRPATIVKLWGTSPQSGVNLVVGWATSSTYGERLGQFITPQELVSLRAQA